MFIEILIIEILMLFIDEVMFVIIYERLEMIMILIVETIVLKILLFFIEKKRLSKILSSNGAVIKKVASTQSPP